MELAQLKEKILRMDPYDFVNEHILSGDCKYFREDQVERVRALVSEATGITIKRSEIHIVGSAKLGYGLFEKKQRDGTVLPPFRAFSPTSDIDVAFSSPELFDTIWEELSSFAVSKPWMPHRMNKLGDYLVYGWLRPDHFPNEVRLHNYDRWNDKVKSLRRENFLDRRKISGALYRTKDFIAKYQAKGIKACKNEMETQ